MGMFKIIDYSKKEMSHDITQLFKEIYPQWSKENINRALYDEKAPLHVATKVAFIDDRAVGQANVFRLKTSNNIANIGFHVHPKYHRLGIGYRLASEVINNAKQKGIKTFLVQTERNNLAALKLSEKLGFSKASKSFIEENSKSLKLCRLKDGVVLRKDI